MIGYILSTELARSIAVNLNPILDWVKVHSLIFLLYIIIPYTWASHDSFVVKVFTLLYD